MNQTSTSDFSAESLALWDRMARGWGRDGDYIWHVSRRVGERMVAALAPAPGDTVLELAAGPGHTGFAAAQTIGSGGRLISTDFSAEMVAVARERAAGLGLDNVDCRVIDAQRIELPDGSVDGVLCRWGYMLVEDPAAAFAETRRVLRNGGRLSMSVWGDPSQNPWAATPAKALVELGYMQGPAPAAPGIFALADQTRLSKLLTDAGFDRPTFEAVEVVWRFATFDAYWRFLAEIAGGIAIVIERIDAHQRRTARQTIRERIEAYRSADGYALPGMSLNALTRSNPAPSTAHRTPSRRDRP